MPKNSFKARGLLVTILLKKNKCLHGTCKAKSMKKTTKHPNRTVNLQALVKTPINSNIAALKLQYHPAMIY